MMNDQKVGNDYILKERFGRLPKTEEEYRWLVTFHNETPCSGKDLDGFIIPGREMFKMIDRVEVGLRNWTTV